MYIYLRHLSWLSLLCTPLEVCNLPKLKNDLLFFPTLFLINAYMSVYCRWFGCGYLHRCPASSHPHYRCSDSYWTRYCYLSFVFNNIVFTFCLPSKNVKASDVPSCCVRLRNSILMFNMSTKSTQIEFIN